ncbi:MAG: hypothetical protein ACP5LE_08155, partial [Thermoplasmata archaeon]
MSVLNESGEGGLGFAQTVMFEEITSKTQRYYCAVIVYYEETYPEPYMSIVLSFGLSERLTDPLDADTDHDIIPDGNDSEPFTPAELPESPFA